MTEIKKKAEKVKKKLGGNISYQELEDYVRSLGVTVLSYSKGEALIKKRNLQKRAEKRESFLYMNDSGLVKVIFIKDDVENKEFLLAHELGHLLLGHKEETNNNDEIEATYFATLLLHEEPEPGPEEQQPRWKKQKRISIVAALVFVVIAFAGYSVYSVIHNSVRPTQTVTLPVITEQQTAPEPQQGPDVPVYATEQTYVVTKSGDKYHLPSCYYVRDKSDLIEVTLEEAEKGGYEPCKVCIGE